MFEELSIEKQLEREELKDKFLNEKKKKEINIKSKYLKVFYVKKQHPDIYIIKPNNWDISLDITEKKNIEHIIHFSVTQTGIINKTEIIFQQIFEIFNTIDSENEKHFFEYLVKCEITPELVYDEIDWMMDIAKKYNEYKGVDFSKFLDKKKITKSSIIFDDKDNLNLFLLSIILKLYMPLSSTTLYKYVHHDVHKQFFKKVTRKMGCVDLIIKIHDLISKKIFRTIKLDLSLIDIIHMKYTKNIEDFALIIFDFIVSSILAIYDLSRNPVTFLATCVSSMIGWEFQDLKSMNVIYKSSEELFDVSSNSRNLMENIVINKLIRDITKYVEKEVKKSQIDLNRIHEILANKDYKIMDSFYDLFIIPLWKYIFKIKYNNINIDMYSKIILQLMIYFSLKKFLNEVLKKYDETEIENISEHFHFLEIFNHIPIKKELEPNKKRTIYSIQNIKLIFEESEFSFFGFNNIMILIDYIIKLFDNLKDSNFIGLTSKKSLIKMNMNKLKYLEKKLLPFINVILYSGNDKNSPNLRAYSKYVVELIKNR